MLALFLNRKAIMNAQPNSQITQKQTGFTLIELMITVAIIGILAAVAVPNYIDYMRRGAIADMLSELQDVKLRMEQRFGDNRDYASTSDAAKCAVPDVTKSNYVLNCVLTNGKQGFTFTATGGGSVAGFVYTANEAGTKTTTSLGAGWSTGVTLPATRWITKKGG